MKKNSKRSATDKVIHIRLDQKTHHKLKVHAATSRATIQQLVENLIRAKYQNVEIGELKP